MEVITWPTLRNEEKCGETERHTVFAAAVEVWTLLDYFNLIQDGKQLQINALVDNIDC
jgi:hypothetical protein